MDWEKEFEQKFICSSVCDEPWHLSGCPAYGILDDTAKDIKSFIRKTLQSQKNSLLEKVSGLRNPKRKAYSLKYEMHGGIDPTAGDYEEALEEVKKIIKAL